MSIGSNHLFKSDKNESNIVKSLNKGYGIEKDDFLKK